MTAGATGFITIRINETKSITLPIVDGKVNWIVPGLAADNYTVYANYSGDGKYNLYNDDNVNRSFEVKQIAPGLVIIDVISEAGKNATVIVKVDSRVTGDVNVTVNGKDYIVAPDENGIAVIVTDILENGTFASTAVYDGDKNFTDAVVEFTIIPNKTSDYELNITAYDVKVDDLTDITVNVPSDARGIVVININGTNYTAVINDGKAVFNNETGLGVGKYNITAYFGNNKYENKTATGVFYIKPLETPISIDVEDIKVGDKAVITVTVPSGVTDNVTIEIDGVKYNKSVDSEGKARFEVPVLSNGTRTVVAIYGGDAKYVYNSTTESFAVTKRNSKLNVTATGSSVGNNATISVEIPSNATGYVIVNVNGTNYTINTTGGVGSVEIAGLGNGTYYVHATYIGDDQYLTSTNDTATFVMTKSDIGLTINVTDINYGQAANITVNVTAGATGFITIRINETKSITLPIVDGKVSWIVEGLAADNYTVYANYSGDGRYNLYNNDNVNRSFEVKQIAPGVEIIKVISEAGKNATVIVKVDSRVTGDVNVTVNGKDYIVAPDENGIAVVVTDILENGTFASAAVYDGDKNFTDAAVEFTIIPNRTSDYEMNVTAGDIKVEELTDIVVNVPSDARGIVIVNINGTNYTAVIADGKATFNNDTSGLAAGRYNITAYFGNNKYENKTATGVFYISKHDAPVTIAVENILVGDNAYINVTAPSDNVTIEINGQTYSATRYEGGVAYFTVPDLAYGDKTVTAIYGGSYKYVANTTTGNFTVSKRSSKVNVTGDVIIVGENATVKVNVTSGATGYVIVRVNGQNYTVNLTESGGSVEIPGLKNSTYTITATYLGDDKFNSSINTTASIKVNKVASTINLTVSENGIIANGSDVNITIKAPIDVTGKVTLTLLNGTVVIKTYTVYVNDGEGFLHLDSPAVGIYNVTATYLENDKYLQSGNETSFEVYKTGGELTVNSPDVAVDTNNTIAVSLSGRHEGEVTITVSNASGIIIMENVTLTPDDTLSHAELTISLLDAGSYSVNALYREVNGTKTVVREGTSGFSVYKLSSAIEVADRNITIFVGENETISLAIELNEAHNGGNISVFVNGVEYNTTTADLTVEISGLNASEYEVLVVYHGNEWYNESSATTSFTVIKNPAPIAIEVTNSHVGDVEQINVTLPGDASGRILLDIAGQKYYADINNGLAQFNITGLKAGVNRFNVTYDGDYKYLENRTNSSLTVSKIQPVFGVNGTDITVGDDELIKFETAENITGTVKVQINDRNYTAFVSQGKGNLTVSGLSAGKYNITLYFTEDEKYLPATARNNFTVNQTTVSIRIMTRDVEYGNNETITVYVNGTGKVTVSVDGNVIAENADLVDGFLTVNATGLAVGRHTVDVAYGGNVNLTAKDAEAYFNVTQAAPEITVGVENITYYGVEHITVNVNAAGNVTVKVNGTPVGDVHVLTDGQVVISVENLAAGVYDVEVTYNGNRNYTTGTAKAVFKIAKAPVTVNVDVSDITVGGKEIINVTISNVNATGNVTVNVDGINHTAPINAEGKANITLDGLTNGTHSVVAIYEGNANLTGNWSSKTFTVNRLTSALTISVSNINTLQSETIRVNVTAGATGWVVISVDGTDHYVEIKQDGYATLILSDLTNITHAVHAEYLGDANYTGCEGDASFNVSKVASTIRVVAEDITVGDAAGVNITVITGATGNVTVKIGDEYETVVGVIDGTFSVVIPGLTVGEKTVEVTYNGNDKYLMEHNSTDFTVKQAATDVIAVAHDIVYGDNETITVYVNATGNVTIKVAGQTFTDKVLVNGAVSVNVSGLGVGRYEVNVTYNGNVNFTAKDAKAYFNVTQAAPEITVGVENITYYGIEHITVNVNADGNVTVKVNGTPVGDVHVLTDGQVIIPVENLAAGVYDVEVTYNGNRNYTTGTARAVFKIAKAPVTVNVQVADIKVGESEVINVTISNINATGIVTINVDGVNYTAEINEGKATRTISGLANGTHSVVAIYEGNANLTGSWSSKTFNVTRYDIGIDLSASAPIAVESPVTFTATLNETVTGDVVFTVNGASYTVHVDNARTATYVYTPLNNQTLSVVATFTGNDRYNRNSTDNEFAVNRVPSEIEVSVALPVVYGSDAVISIELNASVNATVRLTVDDDEYNVALINGKAVFNASGLNSGSHKVNVSYAGDAKYVGSKDNTTFTVDKATLSADAIAQNVTVKQNTSFVIDVPDDFAGNVSLTVAGEVLYDGPAETLILGKVLSTAGNKTATAVFYGDGNYDELTLNDIEFTVSRVDPAIDVVIDDVTYPDKAVAEITISNNANGTVNITVDGKVFNDTVVNGRVSIDLTGLSAGSKVADIEFFSDDDFNSNATAAVKFNIGKANSTVVIEVESVYIYNDTIIINLTTTGSSGTLNVTVNGKSYGINDGKVTIDSLSAGDYTIIASLAGDANYTSAVNSTTFKVRQAGSSISIDVESVYKVGDDIVITLTAVNITDADAISVTINGKSYNVVGGKVTIAGGLDADSYIVNAVLAGNENYTGSKDTKSFEVVKYDIAVDLDATALIVVGTPVTFTATLNETVTGDVVFTINGANYTVHIVNGKTADYVYTPLNNDTLNVAATFTGSDRYNGNTTSNDFTVNRVPVEISVGLDKTSIDVGESALVSIIMDPAINAIVTLNVNDKSYNVAVVNGKGNYTLSGLANGTYTISAAFDGDSKYLGNVSNEVTLEVKGKTVPDISLTVDETQGTAVIELPDDATGNVTIMIDGVEYDVVNITEIPVVCDISGLKPGNHTIEAIYSGDDNYTGASDSTKFEVPKYDDYTIKAESDNIDVGETETISIELSIDVDHAVVEVAGIKYYVNLTGGKGSLNLTGLKADEYTATVTYMEDDYYKSKSNKTTFTVSKVPIEVGLEVTGTYGNMAGISIELGSDIDAIVELIIDGESYNVAVVAGKGTFNATGLSSGDHAANVTFKGDDRYLENVSQTVTFTIENATAKINLVVGNVTYGEEVPVTVFVDATGTVTIEVDGETKATVPLTDGKAEYLISGLDAGDYTVKVTFNPDSNVDSASAEENFTVEKADPTITVEVEDIVYGESAFIIIHSNAEGSVNVTVNGRTITVELNGGRAVLRASRWNVAESDSMATVEVPGLEAGKYPVEVTFNGNDNYKVAAATAEFDVVKANTTVNVEAPASLSVGESLKINVTVDNENASGNVTVNVGGKNYTVKLTDGKGNLTVDYLTSGNYTITAVYEGDGNLTGSWTSKEIEVEKLDADVNIEIRNSTAGNKQIIEVTVPDDATGTVLIDINDKHYYANVSDGKAILELDDLPGDDYSVTATYLGDENYAGKSDSATFKVTKNSSTVNVTVQDITAGENAVITVSVPEDAAGNVTVTVDGKSYTVPVMGGKAELIVSGLEAGNYTVKATYNGDGKYEPGSASSEFEVSKVELTSDEIKVIDQGNGTVVVVVPEDATGNVTVTVDGKNYTAEVVNGTATVTLDDVAPGTHEVAVTYSGDDKYDSVTTTSTVNTPKLAGSISVSVDDIVAGETAEITVTVPRDATGNVTVEIDGIKYTSEIENGKAVFEIDGLAVGNKTIAVDYEGDDKYLADHTTAEISVSKAVPHINVTVGDTTAGEDVFINVEGPGDLTGPVLVDVDGVGYYVNVTDGKGQLVLPGMAGGNHTISAKYAGDDKYAPVNITSSSFDVDKVSSAVSVKADNTTVGDKAVIEITVPDDATGIVTVTVDGKDYNVSVAGGKATLVIPDLEAGVHDITATYLGDDKYEPSTVSDKFEVSKVKLDSDSIKVVDQGNGTVVVVVPEDATGEVTVTVDGKNYTAEVVNGTATVTLDNLTPGAHDIEVAYSGDDTYDGATTSSSVTAPKLTDPISVSVEDIEVGDAAVITVTVPEDATGTVTLEIDGETYTAEIENGKAVFEIQNLTAGTKTFAVDYEGDGNYVVNHTTGTIIVSKREANITVEIEDIDAGENVTVIVTLPDDATGLILIDIGGVGYYANVTGGKAVAQIPRVPSGIYDVNVTYTGDDKYSSRTGSASLNVSKVESFVIPIAEDIYVGENEHITVLVPEDATGTVTIVIGGKEYEFDLDEEVLTVSDDNEIFTIAVDKGVGKLTISGLPKGDYTLSVRYNGDDKYLPSTNSTVFRVMKSNTTMDTIDLENGTAIVELPENATGTVTITIGNETYTAKVINGTAVFDFNNTLPGKYPAVVEYSGDATHDPQRMDTTIIVPKYDSPISVEIGDIEVGDTAVVTVNVPEGSTGNVTIEIDGETYTAEIISGKATFNVKGLGSGNKTVVVAYVGDRYYHENFTSTQFKVIKKASSISSTSKDIKAGNDEVITVTVPSDATGRVLVKINGVGYYADVKNGKAKVVIPDLPAGKYKATVFYEGDDQYDESETITTTFTVSKVSAPISASTQDIKIGEDGTVVVTLPEDATGTVTVTVDGKKYTAPVIDGQAVFEIPGLNAGDHKVIVSYSGDRKYDANTTVTDIEVHGSDEPEPHHGENDVKVKAEVGLEKYPTGNPIFLLLIILLSLGFARIRRF